MYTDRLTHVTHTHIPDYFQSLPVPVPDSGSDPRSLPPLVRYEDLLRGSWSWDLGPDPFQMKSTLHDIEIQIYKNIEI